MDGWKITQKLGVVFGGAVAGLALWTMPNLCINGCHDYMSDARDTNPDLAGHALILKEAKLRSDDNLQVLGQGTGWGALLGATALAASSLRNRRRPQLG